MIDDYVYIHVRRERTQLVVSWRMNHPQAVECQALLRVDASEWDAEQMRRAAATHLHLPEADTDSISVGE